MKNVNILFILLIVTFSCSLPDGVQIVKTNIGNNNKIDLHEQIVFQFSEDLWDMNNNIDISNLNFITFQPAVEGSFYWISPNELIFSPNYIGFAPATEYSATLNKDILKNKPELSLPDNKVFHFNTGYIDFEKVNHYWDFDKLNNKKYLNVAVKLNMNFKYSNLNDFFEFNLNNTVIEAYNYNKLSETELNLSFLVDDLEISNKDVFSIIIKKGAIISEGIINQRQAKTDFNLTSPNEFLLTNTESETNIDACFITYYFNHSLNPEINYKEHIKIEPELEFFTEYAANKLILSGDFQPGMTYKITLQNSMQSIFGTKLKDISIEYIKLGELYPFLDFVEKNSIYLPSKGSRNIAVQIHSVKNLYLNIFKVYENNILQLFQKGKIFDSYYDESLNEEYYWEIYDTKTYGDLVHTQKIELENLEKFKNAHLLNINFQDYLKDKGIYIVRLIDSSNLSLQTDRIVSVSDLGIIAKSGIDDLFIAVNSLTTGLPVSGARVSLISENNQAMEQSLTKSDGTVILRELSRRKFAKVPKLIRVESGNDYNYMFLGNISVLEQSVFENLGGSEATGYKAFIFGDREIYRPGDTLHISGIVRDENIKSVKNMPVTVQLLLPNSKMFKEFVAETDENGGFNFSYLIPNGILTGNYKIRAYTSGKKQIGERKINIEQFIPQKIKVDLSANKDYFLNDEIIEISAKVENLYGTPAANSNYDGNIYFTEKPFKNRELRNYTFSLTNTNIESYYQQLNGQSDAQGNIKISYNPTNVKNIGKISANILLTVYDDNNRPVNTNKIVEINTQPYFIGIGKINKWLNLNSNYNIPIVAVNSSGQKFKNAKVLLQVIKKTWNTVTRRSEYNDYFYHESILQNETILTREININGKESNFQFKPTSSGVYEIRAYLPNAESYVSYQLMAYNYGMVSNNDFEVSKEGYIDIESELEKYNIGDKARILFKTPFNGRLIVTVERQGVIDNYSLTTNARTAELTLDIKEEYLPNIYISAILIKPIVDISIPITVAYGYLPLKVDKANSILPLTIKASSNVRSSTMQTVKVKTIPKKNINVTIGIVDEGIHQIKNTKIPDPHGFFYEKRALSVNTFDVYKLLFPELKKGNQTFGGDEGSFGVLSSMMLNQFADERVKPVAFWSGILKTNSSGEAEYSFLVPEFSGTLRITATAYIDDSFGASDTSMIVKDPIVLSTSIPRFLSTGDKSFGNINIANTTSNKVTYEISYKTSGPINIEGLKSNKITIDANSKKRVELNFNAKDYEGLAEISFTVSGGGETKKETTKIPVRFPAGYSKYFKSGNINAKQNITVDFSDKFNKGSTITNVILSKYPVIEYFNGLEFLIDYSHGCMEQNISKTFPLLYFPDLIKVSRISTDNNLIKDADLLIKNMIDRTKMLQLPDGGWATWESGYESHWWTSVYAAHFLVSAQNAGYEINSNSLSKALNYIKLKSLNANLSTNNDNSKMRKFYPKEAIYGLFVLSLANKSDFSMLNYYKSKINKLSVDSKTLLACSYKLLGDNTNFRNIMDKINMKFDERDETPYSNFSTPLRDMAITLYSLANADKNDVRIPSLTKIVSQKLKDNKNLTTQEAAFGFMAIGKILNNSQTGSNIKAKADSEGKNIVELNETTPNSSGKSYSSKVNISNIGDSKMYYFVNSVGKLKNGKIENFDNYIQIRREFFSSDGRKLNNKKDFKIGELVVVKLSVRGVESNFSTANLVISDLLPAGLEIENPRLSEQSSYKWLRDLVNPNHYDYRDDRVNIYFDLDKKADFYYTIRAITPGIYNWGAVTCEAMYESDVFSIYGGNEQIKVNK